MPRFLRVILLVLPLLLHVSTQKGTNNFIKPSFAPYCSIKDMCKAPCSCRGSSDCHLESMDDDLRASILFYLNQIRQIQTLAEPEPSGMTMLQYDMQLEEVSKCSALSCQLNYTTCFTTPRFPETSQTVWGMKQEYSNNSFLWVQIVNSWFNETNRLTSDHIGVMPGGETGEKLHNYAQLVSDNIHFVGCAWSSIKDNFTFVCTFGPRGPAWGEAIYKRGNSCTTCPEGYSCDKLKPFQNLCKYGVGMTTLPSVITPPLPPPLPPVKVPPMPPPLAASRGPLPPTTNAPQPPPLPPEKKCPGASGCYENKPFGQLKHDSAPSKKSFESLLRPYPPSSHMRLHQNNPPVPLRSIPHSRILSSSLISQPSIPIRSRLTSAIGRNRSHPFLSGIGKQLRLTHSMDSATSQLVQSHPSTFSSSVNAPKPAVGSFQNAAKGDYQDRSRVSHDESYQKGKQGQFVNTLPREYVAVSQTSHSRQDIIPQGSFHGPRKSHGYESPASPILHKIENAPQEQKSSRIQPAESSSFNPLVKAPSV